MLFPALASVCSCARVLVCPRRRTARTSSTTARVIGDMRHSSAAGPGRRAGSGASVVFSVFSIFSVRLYASTVASALSSFAVSTRSSAFRVSSAFLAASRERSHASSRECVSSSSHSSRFLLSAYSTTCLMSFATLRLSSGARSCSVQPATSAVEVEAGAASEGIDQSSARNGASAGWTSSSNPEDAATRFPGVAPEGAGGAAASAGAGAGAGAGGRERLILGLCVIADAAGGRSEAFGLAFWVAATRERTCAYGSFSLARAVAAPRVPCAGGLTAPLPNEAEAPHGFCAGATDARASASDRRAIATVDLAPSRDARVSVARASASSLPSPLSETTKRSSFARKRSNRH